MRQHGTTDQARLELGECPAHSLSASGSGGKDLGCIAQATQLSRVDVRGAHPVLPHSPFGATDGFAGVRMIVLVGLPCCAPRLMAGSVVRSCCLWHLAVIPGRAVLRAGSG